MTTALTRRTLLASAIAAGVAGPLAAAGPASAARPRLTLPAPTGPHPIGTVERHLADGRRELMVGIWYPAAARRGPVVPWMPGALLRALLADNGLPSDAAASPLTAAHEGAPALRALGRRPVIVFSHGADGHRSEITVIVQELASHGYTVVTVDHTDSYTEFPGGRLHVPDDDVSVTPYDHADDITFVLDHLEDVTAGRRIGMFGYSKGGTATAIIVGRDRRVRAGISLDGPMECQPPLTTDIHRPFLMLTASFPRTPGSSAADFWTHLKGWRRDVHIDGGTEISFSDAVWLLPQLARLTGMSDEDLAGWIGTYDPARAVRLQQTYPLAFFDQHLR
ncbi:alpha/beta hydrolase family protein [Paractinoplanes atraurantiacus]|uniref:Platelet-activating factor acetylhydrolase, isoform II n=1 Tax=Paractinoplanes atraurantiacus TaxID=1036182 RepID=A0A285IX89_9ACTN|nr:alpha/beta hydrolase [Actinoplanes atraurantiacus]SNY52649.1 Platelet-activating factor acetylhydrolase, isoform II [Actinoplanes atraurantiacus]